LLSVFLLVGHLYLALIHPSTRHALRGMTTGEVDESWARKHHAKWVETENRPPLR
jgi:formate dehydrogenase subunit gamma